MSNYLTKEIDGVPKLVQSCWIDSGLIVYAEFFNGETRCFDSSVVRSGGKFDDAYFADVETFINKHFEPEWLIPNNI